MNAVTSPPSPPARVGLLTAATILIGLVAPLVVAAPVHANEVEPTAAITGSVSDVGLVTDGVPAVTPVPLKVTVVMPDANVVLAPVITTVV